MIVPMSFFFFQTQLGNFPLAIKDELQEEKVLPYFGAVTQSAAVALDLAPCEFEGAQRPV